jgi:hypothetical protein
MNAERNEAEVRAVARRVLDWLASEEGQKAMQSSGERADQTSALLEEALEITRDKLHEPYTV